MANNEELLEEMNENEDSFGMVKQRFKDRSQKVVQTKEMMSKRAVQTKEILSKQAVKIAKQAEEHERFINKVFNSVFDWIDVTWIIEFELSISFVCNFVGDTSSGRSSGSGVFVSCWEQGPKIFLMYIVSSMSPLFLFGGFIIGIRNGTTTFWIFAIMPIQSSWLIFFSTQEMKSFSWFASHLLR
ncbi:hypothetical protein Patl1_13534 [Pistacia atlantica]|uniref:Uncharacterized protein n=1 Tax=Pistacia atlantica TaxID=434234 RepID=A0ACC1AX19_9ROSI|nr:hypothetical protein Patl1_13534 [Pistacia atlantica]